MQILKPVYPIVVELTEDDMTLMHLALYEYKEYLKHRKQGDPAKRRAQMKILCKLINLVDLVM